jgi:hypothetical protein
MAPHISDARYPPQFFENPAPSNTACGQVPQFNRHMRLAEHITLRV